MKKSFSRLLLLIPSLLLLLPLASEGGSGPRVQFGTRSIDYGKVPLEKVVKPRFPFKNVGDAPLRVTNKFCHDNFILAKALEGC